MCRGHRQVGPAPEFWLPVLVSPTCWEPPSLQGLCAVPCAGPFIPRPLWLDSPPSGVVLQTEARWIQAGSGLRPAQTTTFPELLFSRVGTSGHSQVDEGPLEGWEVVLGRRWLG